ncbi:hypothetical protein CIB48_g1696 [Xylaria polymorpha]|nr:hypothetical protein CIB48_g1696 [Xylaria polymorpha]
MIRQRGTDLELLDRAVDSRPAESRVTAIHRQGPSYNDKKPNTLLAAAPWLPLSFSDLLDIRARPLIRGLRTTNAAKVRRSKQGKKREAEAAALGNVSARHASSPGDVEDQDPTSGNSLEPSHVAVRYPHDIGTWVIDMLIPW